MSRVGKQIISIPAKTEVTYNDNVLTVKGPLGELSRQFRDDIEIKIEENQISFTPKYKNKDINALWGTYASHVKNMVSGVNTLYEKKLILEGVGYKVAVEGNTLSMALGFSHPVKIEIPKGLTVTAEKNNVSISGIDKELVGQYAAKIRALKKPEPYKGKGFRYDGEVIRRKEGKKTA